MDIIRLDDMAYITDNVLASENFNKGCLDMRNDLRDIYFYDLTVRSSSQYARPCPLEDAITVLERISKTASRIHPIAKGTEFLELR